MAKFSGCVGYEDEFEEVPGVWETRFLERPVRGDILRKNHRWAAQGHSTISADSSSEQITIGADDFVMRLCRQKKMRYIKYEGDDIRYAINDAAVDRPRVVLTIGGVFNG